MKIRSENSPRKPQVAETGIVGLKLRLDEFIAVEIHECDLALRELIAKSSLMDQEVRVSLMARAFADHYGCGIEPKESFRGGAAAPMSFASVFTGFPEMNATMLGFSKTDLPRTFRLKSRIPRYTRSSSSSEYRSMCNSAICERLGRRSRKYFRCCHRIVIAEPATAAEPTSQSRLFISSPQKDLQCPGQHLAQSWTDSELRHLPLRTLREALSAGLRRNN